MIIPEPDELNLIASMIREGRSDGTTKFVDLNPEARIQVFTMAQQGVLTQVLDDIDTSLRDVSEWFKKSRLYEP